MIRRLSVTKRAEFPCMICTECILDDRDVWDPETLTDVIRSYFYNNNVDEHVWLVCWDYEMQLIGITELTHGNSNCAQIEWRSILQRCVLCNAFCFTLLHNHPSGSLLPSHQDYAVTEYLIERGKEMECNLVQHLIINDLSWKRIDMN